jgi:hypothetical protein
MATKKKLLQAAAGQAGGEALNVEDVFSTFLYEGNEASSRSISNGINLSDEGGLVWFKARASSISVDGHELVDTERGVQQVLRTNTTGTDSYDADHLTAFNTDGFTISDDSGCNQNSTDYVSWTWRKAPKFFDILTYSGTGAVQSIAHNLGSTPGCIITKKLGGAGGDWCVYHRGANGGTSPEDYYLVLNGTAAENNSESVWDSTAPTDTHFTVGTNTIANTDDETYVAYLFAHNDGDGEFGPDGDADIIKCGSFTTNGNGDASIDLGFEPQWVLLKRTDSAQSWWLADTMRGMTVGTAGTAYLVPDQNYAEDSTYTNYINPTATGFDVDAFSGSADYIYIAIRRGPMAVPEDADDVFAIDTHDSTEPLYDTSFPVDFGMYRRPDLTQGMYLGSRMQGAKELRPNATSKEDNNPYHLWDYQNGWGATGAGSSGSYSWMWRRAPNFFDVVAYTGNGTAGRTVSHNLGVAPEMMWVKRRNSATDWRVYHKDIGNTHNLQLNLTAAKEDDLYWNDTTPTDSVFTLNNFGDVNGPGYPYIAYLFASLDGVSKVGSYSGNGSTQTIDCGFSAGARFVLIKRTNGTGGWYLFDTERGIVSGNDPYLELNDTGSQNSTTDYIDPDNSGFALTQNGLINASSGEYIFYAIA